ncbi:hypothetical protein SBOR_2919 [Sclerotinia borealis F-4128]|uniref:RNase H type-1 domain-containing protein n=1 Tax=Sclerotinia borealis (strain F-4128) TaxID=1432307 RepID=W9CQ86_SCLBF|nr:hypothetical protein SBOR_2919 [Sclerotinia borealis F-4128]
MADLPTVPTHDRYTPSISSTDYKITTPATNDRSLHTENTDANPLVYPRKFDLATDTELYVHENRNIPRLFFYEPGEELQISRMKLITEGHFIGHPRTLVFSVAGAVSPLKRDDSHVNLGFDFPSSSSSNQNTEEKFQAAYSVHFGPKSRYNTTGKVKETGSKIEMQKIVELAAACEALEFVEMECKMRHPGFEDVSGEIAPGGLVVGVTSSTNLWYGITEHIYKWKRNDFRNSKGSKVVGEELWKRFDECMNRFEYNQTRVAWILCEKEENEAEEAAWRRVTDTSL